MSKPSFERFLKETHKITFPEFMEMDNLKQIVIETDYKTKYGRIQRWFEK